MSPTDFIINTEVMVCSYDIAENGLLTCNLEDYSGIMKEANNVSFRHVEPAFPIDLSCIIPPLTMLLKRNSLLGMSSRVQSMLFVYLPKLHASQSLNLLK